MKLLITQFKVASAEDSLSFSYKLTIFLKTVTIGLIEKESKLARTISLMI